MAEYICREAILDDLEQEIEAGNVALDEDVWVNKGLRIAIRDIKDIKSADVQLVVHAYWIRGKEYGFRTQNSTWYCSNCGGSIRYDTTLRTYQKHKKSVEEVNCFCRKCGAKMDLPPIYERDKESEE